MASDDVPGREFYEVWLTPARLVACEQLYAQCQDELRKLLAGLTEDVERRETVLGIHDDSAQFALLHSMIGQQIFQSAEDIVLTVNLLSAALFKLVRAPRTESNPLAHLENEGDK